MSDPWVGEDEPSLVGKEWKDRALTARSRLREAVNSIEYERGQRQVFEAECDRLRGALEEVAALLQDGNCLQAGCRACEDAYVEARTIARQALGEDR